MNLLIVSATPFEIAPLIAYLEENFNYRENGLFDNGKIKVEILITGPGIAHAVYHLTKRLAGISPTLIINAGVAGSFDPNIHIGSVVNVTHDKFADLGAEDANSNFIDIFEMGLMEKNDSPFEEGWLVNPSADQATYLPNVRGITVQKVHGAASSIQEVANKYHPQIESMEGAAVAFVCLLQQIPYLQIRSISNKVEPRNKDNWDLDAAITNLGSTLISMLNAFATVSKD